MRTSPLLLTGLGVSLGIVLLNTQVESLAGSESIASSIGVTSASVLSTEVHEEVTHEDTHAHEYEHDHQALEEVIAKRASDQPLRRVVTKAAAGTPVAPKQRSALLASIDQPDIEMNHKQIANDVLIALPAKCRNTLQHFYVKYEKQKHRGLAGKSVMILDGTVPDSEFRALFVHESGHNWDLGCLRGTSEAGKSAFSDGDEPIYNDDPSLGFYGISWITSSVQKSNANPEDFVSGYASYNIFEDFAESFAYFVLQNDTFAARAQDNDALAKKYVFLRDVVFDGEVPHIATGKAPYNGREPWDVTKLAYAWHPDLTVAHAN